MENTPYKKEKSMFYSCVSMDLILYKCHSLPIFAYLKICNIQSLERCNKSDTRINV